MDRRPSNLTMSVFATTACAIALRTSLKDHAPIFLGKPFTLALVIPSDFRKEFERAFHVLQKTEEGLASVELGREIVDFKGRRDFSDIKAALRLSERVLIYLERDDVIPAFVIAAADMVLAVNPIDAAVLVEAVKTVHEVELSKEDAERMLAFPIRDVLSALRPGRSHSDTLARLEAARWNSLDRKVPPVEELAGYGEVGEWAQTLKADIADWKRGVLAWEDVDAAVLLSGPSGLGKTLFSRSLARSCDCAFTASSLAQWQAAGHLGDLLGAMRTTFKLAAERAPCVLLLDEFDSIGDRSQFSGRNAQYSTEVVAALLECLDGAYRREGVVVVGACNYPERIDAALLRPGRLGKHYRLSHPDTAARRGILSTHFADKLATADLERLAAETVGFTGADLAQLAKDARRKARHSGGQLGLEDALSCLPPAVPIDGELRRRIAVHEAGHVAVGLALDIGRLAGVRVMNSFGKVGLGGTAYFERESRLTTNDFYLRSVAVDLAGMAAETIIFGEHLDGAGGQPGSDLNRAADIATAMVANLGMGRMINFLSAKNADELDRLRRSVPSVGYQVEGILGAQFSRAKDIVTKHASFVEALASALVKDGAVDGETALGMFLASGGYHAS